MDYTYKAKLVKIVDGDTVDLIVDLGFDTFRKERFRLYGINAPESRTRDLKEKEKGLAAKKYLTELTEKLKYIQTMQDKKGKYGRFLVKLFNTHHVCINDIMVKAKHAVYKDY